MSELRITAEWLRERRACARGIEAFVAAYPDGLDYDPTCARQAAEILSGPLAGYVGWAIDQGLPAQRLTGGDYSTVTGGIGSTVTGGIGSTVTGGIGSTVTGGIGSTVTGGIGSTVTGGDYSTVTGGDCSTVTGDYYSTVTGGIGSTVTGGVSAILTLRHHDGERWRLVTAYVGEDGIEPGVRYRLDPAGRFVRAEEVKDA